MSSQPYRRRRRAAAFAAALCLACGLAGAAPIDDLRRQVESGQFEPAYATARANPQLIGDVHFDFLYGVAAVSSGHVAEGLLALERHLAAVPANDRARLELARGYFLLGEYTRARAEFAFVLRYNPPAGVRASIDGFLEAMQVRETSNRRSSARFYAEAGMGHDSNVNGGTFRDELQLIFGNVSLVGSPSQQVPDNYTQLSIGGQQLMRVTSRFSIFAGADLDQRSNFRARAYDLTTGGAYLGFTQLAGSALWRLTLGSSELVVGGRRYRDTLSVATEANFTLGPELVVSGFAQYGEQRHAVVDEVRDARSISLGGGVSRSFAQLTGEPVVGARLSWTSEHNQRLRSDLSREMPLLRVYASASPADRTRLTLGLNAYTQKYGNVDIGFGSTRADHALGADLTLNYALDASWSLRADATWSRNRSSQGLYDSNRNAASVKARYQY